MFGLEEKYSALLADPSQSINLSWVQLVVSTGVLILSYYLMDYVGSWASSDMTDHQLTGAIFGAMLYPLGLFGMMTAMNRLITYQLYPVFVPLALTVFLAIAFVTVGFVLFVVWEGVAYLEWNEDAVTPIRMLQSCYFLCMALAFFFCLGIHFLRTLKQLDIWGAGTQSQSAKGSIALEEMKQDDDTETRPLMASGGGGATASVQAATEATYTKESGGFNWRGHLAVVGYFVVFLPFMLILNGFLPGDWHKMYVTKMESYVSSASSDPWAINIKVASESTSSGRRLLADQDVYLFIYGDLIAYYGFIIVVSLIAYFVHMSPSAKLAMRKRFVVIPQRFGPIPYVSVSLGEILFWLLWLGMFIALFVYWLNDHIYDGDSTKGWMERTARFMGILSILFLSFQFFAISRVRLWMDCFNLSFEHLIAYHRFFGYLMLLTAYLHFFLWLAWFGKSDDYPLSENGPFLSQPPTYHSDNFTYTYMYYVMIFMVPFAYGIGTFWWVRRNYFDVFYYTHLISSFIFVFAILFHATQAWRYLVPPLVLYFFDRCLRFVDSTRLARVEQLTTTVVGGHMPVAHLSFTVAQMRMKGDEMFAKLPYKMGQYCFINIPNIGLYEWHPFTISSSEYAPSLSMHIKSAGDGSWSGKLNQLAASEAKNVELHVDGPYGKPFDAEGYDRVVLVAGGIGITPCHSIFESMLTRADVNAELVPQIDLVWVTRDTQYFQLFLQTLRHFEELQTSQKFSVRLHCTAGDVERSGGGTVNGTDIHWSAGRPQWVDELSFIAAGNGAASNTLIFACGPAPLVEAVQSAADTHGAHFYAESFEF